MNRASVRVPQIGEGISEVRVVTFLKHAGEPVARDEPLLELETDKAVFEVPSPATGTVARWEVKEDDLLSVGALIGTIVTRVPFGADLDSDSPAIHDPDRQEGPAGPGAPDRPEGPPVSSASDAGPGRDDVAKARVHDVPGSDGSLRNRVLSPRVRAFCRAHGITSEEIYAMANANPGGRLSITDAQRWLAAKSDADYKDRPLSPRQRALARRLTRGRQQVVPTSLELECDWDAIQLTRTLLRRQSRNACHPSALELIVWCVTRAMEKHPKFRSTVANESTLREHKHVCLGIAVALPEDELAIAVLPRADCLSFVHFIDECRRSLQEVKENGATDEVIQLNISYMGPYGMRSAWPVIVPPAVATLFIGACYDVPARGDEGAIAWRRCARLVLNFDHRFINGIGGARFLRDIQRLIKNLPGMPLLSASDR